MIVYPLHHSRESCGGFFFEYLKVKRAESECFSYNKTILLTQAIWSSIYHIILTILLHQNLSDTTVTVAYDVDALLHLVLRLSFQREDLYRMLFFL